MNPTLVVVTGFALCGKNTIASRLANELGYYYQDIDKLQIDVFGWEGHPKPDPTLVDLSPLLKPLRKQHLASIYMLLAMAEAFLEVGESIVISALSISERNHQDQLKAMVEGSDAKFKQILCVLKNPTKEEIEKRIARDSFGVGYNVRLCATYEQYLYGLRHYEKPYLPHLVVDTTKPLEECINAALNYIRSD